MQKTATCIILLLLAALALSLAWHPDGMMADIDGERIDGPLGALLGLLFAGGGVLIAGIVLVVVGAVLAMTFAGVGIIVLGALGVGAMALAAAIAPLLPPLLLPLALIWFFAKRARKQRMLREQAL
jgi:hypothetical protein